ncbi:MAG TPA: hypothetical protein ENF94_00240 [Candidatus Woesearchaeota archaeon]|nr:hypothetical protein [Candidatus Woesearchaeota archaeon]
MGNSDLERNVYGGGIKVIRYDNKLYSIIKFDDLSKSIFYAGKFSKQDGSALQVVETFEDDAKEYIRLYEERFGKPASYEILERS